MTPMANFATVVFVSLFLLTPRVLAHDATEAKLSSAAQRVLQKFRLCARRQEIQAQGQVPFVYCGAPIHWSPARAEEVRACLTRNAVWSIDVLPSYRVKNSSTFSVLYNCSTGFMSIELESVRGFVWIGGVFETVP
jgi:hypothetical protein